MKYDQKKIGSRIAKERKENGYTQDELSALLPISRGTLIKIERGEGDISLNTILAMCEIFNCDVSYLLCEYDSKTEKSIDIHKATGLSEKAANNLIHCKDVLFFENKETNIFNCILEDQKIFEFKTQLLENYSAHLPYSDLTQREKDFIEYTTITMFVEIMKRGFKSEAY